MKDSAAQWYVISLRPRGGHSALRRAAARHGAGLVALSPWAVRTCNDAVTRQALTLALQAPRVVFTSPAAVRAARALRTAEGRDLAPAAADVDRQWFGVGAGTLAALRRAGVAFAQAPARMDSEGLLAMPGLSNVTGLDVGLVTAPGGRDALAPALLARGARVRRADVYLREAVSPTPREVEALRRASAWPCVIAVSSAAALAQVLGALPADLAEFLRRCPAVAASDRLVDRARDLGVAQVARAANPRPAALADAARVRASGSMR